ncbi:MAG: ABC transporter permease, partial [Phototrophicales bacterium]
IKSEPEFLLGTDSLGRDVLSRVIYGARVSMVVGFLPTLIILLVGTTVGMISGYLGGWADNLLMRLTDVVYAFPDLLFFIIVMVALRDSFIGQFMNGLVLLFAALAIVNWVGVARLIRGQVLSIKQKEFIEAARCIG